MEFGIFFIVFLVFCAWLGWKAAMWKRGEHERNIKRQAEYDLRAELIYEEAQQKAAAKILRERGETP